MYTTLSASQKPTREELHRNDAVLQHKSYFDNMKDHEEVSTAWYLWILMFSPLTYSSIAALWFGYLSFEKGRAQRRRLRRWNDGKGGPLTRLKGKSQRQQQQYHHE